MSRITSQICNIIIRRVPSHKLNEIHSNYHMLTCMFGGFVVGLLARGGVSSIRRLPIRRLLIRRLDHTHNYYSIITSPSDELFLN